MQVFLLVTFKILSAFFELTLERFDLVDGDDAPVFGVTDDSQPAESESHRPVIRCLDARPAGGERGDHLLRVDSAFPAPLKSVLREVKSAHECASVCVDMASLPLCLSFRTKAISFSAVLKRRCVRPLTYRLIVF